VIAKVAEAQSTRIFSNFEVLFVGTSTRKELIRRPDPIIFGRIQDCPDLFFIAEWDDDVSIRDLVGEHGG
jgi:hypothetical protein